MFDRFLKSPRPNHPQASRLSRGNDKQRRRRLLIEGLEDRRLLAAFS